MGRLIISKVIWNWVILIFFFYKIGENMFFDNVFDIINNIE